MQRTIFGAPLEWSVVRTEFIAALATFLTLSYTFILNPVLLSNAQIDISAAFFATVISAFLSTLLMGVWAKLPIAVAPAPSLTTFFVSYVVLTLEIPWQAALVAVVASGFLSVAMAALSVRKQLIKKIFETQLSNGILMVISGFLIAAAFRQAQIVSHSEGFLDFESLSMSAVFSEKSLILLVGLAVTLIFRLKQIRFSGAPLLGILVATIIALSYGITSGTKATFGWHMLSAAQGMLQFTFSSHWVELISLELLLSTFVFFIIDFFGGVGKFAGLYKAIDNDFTTDNPSNANRGLYVDGWGNVAGGLLGASGIAVFISSAVGITSGARYGLSAVFISLFMLASLALIPLVGAVPSVATSGILVYVAIILLPFKEFRLKGGAPKSDIAIWLIAALLAFLTFGVDKAILLVFAWYSFQIVRSGEIKDNLIVLSTAVLLGIAVFAQMLLS